MIQAICTAYVERFHLSPTPRISVGIHRTADSVSAPRAFHPRQDLCFSAAPIACDGFAPQGTYHARTVAGQEYHCPYCRSSPYRELPGTDSQLFSLSIGQGRPWTVQSIRWCPLCLCLIHHGAVAKVAYAHYNSNRFVLDDWIFGYQGAPHLLTEREMGEELSVVPHPFPQ